MSKDQKIAQLEAMIVQLLEEIAVLKAKKNSGNSSMNPASDVGKPSKVNLREKSGRKPGGSWP